MVLVFQSCLKADDEKPPKSTVEQKIDIDLPVVGRMIGREPSELKHFKKASEF